MKKLQLLALASAAVLLSACGGGGGGGEAVVATQDPVVITPAAVTVSAMVAPAITPADCPRLQSDALSSAALDLTNTNIKAINDYLLEVDATHAYQVFTRRPADFVNWVANNGGTVNIDTLPLAAHETMHMVDNALRPCAPATAAKLQFFGTQLVTGIVPGATPAISIVDMTIAAGLKTAPRYALYITGGAPGNEMSVLLDELAAYTGAAHTEVQMVAKGKASGDTRALDSQVAGMVNLMVYLQNYLLSARTNFAGQYATIKADAATVTAMQTIWSRAEQVLQDAYPYSKVGSTPQLTVPADYFAAAYSVPLLAELDAVGVTVHGTAATWSGKYLP